ncbi:hypothetical protein JCM11641_001614 [Rhodosporidiobolus odoratus]
MPVALTRPPTVASPLAFTPRRTAHLLHLLLSLSTTSFILTLYLYLLSPHDLILFLIRVAVQLQLTNPRRAHPGRSLRAFVLGLWVPETGLGVGWHAWRGSRGTKGIKGGSQGGVLLDFIGQAHTPSTTHLILLDLVLATLQLATVIVSFGATVPSDLDSTAAASAEVGEAAREYGGLLGEQAQSEVEEEEGEGEAEGEERRGHKGSKGGYAQLEEEEERSEAEDLFAEVDALYPPKPPSTSHPSSLSTSHLPFPPIADIHLRTLWREIRLNAAQSRRARDDARVEGVEEGRGGAQV